MFHRKLTCLSKKETFGREYILSEDRDHVLLHFSLPLYFVCSWVLNKFLLSA